MKTKIHYFPHRCGETFVYGLKYYCFPENCMQLLQTTQFPRTGMCHVFRYWWWGDKWLCKTVSTELISGHTLMPSNMDTNQGCVPPSHQGTRGGTIHILGTCPLWRTAPYQVAGCGVGSSNRYNRLIGDMHHYRTHRRQGPVRRLTLCRNSGTTFCHMTSSRTWPCPLGCLEEMEMRNKQNYLA